MSSPDHGLNPFGLIRPTDGAGYDHCTAAYLAQAGVTTDFVRLQDWGLRGNGHMVMLERNSAEIADRTARWLIDRRRSGGTAVVLR